MTREQKLENLLQDIVADVEAMRSPERVLEDGDEAECWFGGFGSSKEEEGDYGFPTTHIEWPNLALDIASAKRILQEGE